MVNHVYTNEEKQFLGDNILGRSYRDMTLLFNARFDLDLSESAVKGAIKRYGYKNGRNCCFTKGNEPPNKGKKGTHFSPHSEFKKGHVPVCFKPVGTEIVDDEGYRKIKIADPNMWAFKHRVIWEKENGTIPTGSTLIFADGDRANTNIDNLILMTRAELLTANRKGLIYKDPELTRTGTLIAKVIARTWEVHREQRSTN